MANDHVIDNIYIIYSRVYREGGRAMRAWLLSLSQEVQQPLLCLCPVWTGATVQPWGAALMSCLLVCSRLCCCLRSALASNGCKYSQRCRRLILYACHHLFALLHIQTLSKQMTSRRCAALCGFFAACFCVLWSLGPVWQLWNGPQHSSIRGEVVCSISDEGQREGGQ